MRSSGSDETWRERKRQETTRRITASAFKLFGIHGYDTTTLEAIAADAGISPRTFFHYFKSKEDIVLAWQDSLPGELLGAMASIGDAHSALETLRTAVLDLARRHDAAAAKALLAMVQSSERLRAANYAKFTRLEQAAFEALRTRWPDPSRAYGLRVMVGASVSALRISLDHWTTADETTSLPHLIEKAFAALEAELSSGAEATNELPAPAAPRTEGSSQ